MKKLLIRFISLSFLVLLGSCGSQENQFELIGKADVADGTKIYVLQADQNNQPYIKDSTTVQSNNFKFQGISSTPQISYIQVEGVNGYVLAILENGDIKADLFKDSISKSKVYGTKSNDDLDALARHLIDAGSIDEDGIRHTAKVAWRALACLQKELELGKKKGLVAAVEQYNRNRDVKDHITSIEQLPIDIISGTESAYVDGGI